MRPFELNLAQQRRLESIAADYDVKKRGTVSDDEARRRSRRVIEAAGLRKPEA